MRPLRKTHARIAAGVGELDAVVAAGGDATRLRNQTMEIGRDLHGLIERVSVIIHGGLAALDQPDIDGLFSQTDSSATINQNGIDALFD